MCGDLLLVGSRVDASAYADVRLPLSCGLVGFHGDDTDARIVIGCESVNRGVGKPEGSKDLVLTHLLASLLQAL